MIHNFARAVEIDLARPYRLLAYVCQALGGSGNNSVTALKFFMCVPMLGIFVVLVITRLHPEVGPKSPLNTLLLVHYPRFLNVYAASVTPWNSGVLNSHRKPLLLI